MDPALPVPTAQGLFAKTPWAHLLVYAFEKRLTGSFELGSQGRSSATVVFVSGAPAKIRTRDGAILLGDVMHELGLITAAQLEVSRKALVVGPDDGATAKLHGQLLQELGFATPEAVLAGVTAQLEHKLDRLFDLPPDTAYAYFDGYDALAAYGGAPTPVLPFRVLWRGIRRSAPSEQMHATLAKVQELALRTKGREAFGAFDFDAESLAMLERMRTRPARISEMLLEQGSSRPTLDKLIYCLVITKQADLVDPATLPKTLALESERPPSSARQGHAASPVSVQPAMPPRTFTRPTLELEDIAPRSATTASRTSHTSQPPPPTRAPTSDFPSLNGWGLTEEETQALESAPTAEETALRRKITEKANAIASQDYFQMLGIGQEASAEAIEKSYFALAKTWHPDRLSPRLADVKDACAKVFSHLSEAHAVLADPVRREEYMTLLREGGATPDDQAKIQSVLDASTAFQKAEFFLKRNDLPAALEHAQAACRLDPEQVDHLALLTWLESTQPENMSSERTLEKIAVFDRCVVLKPNCERAFFWRGQLYKRLVMNERAVHDFKKAAELNPRNLDAVREVRLHEMRSSRSTKAHATPTPGSMPPPSGQSRSGLFGRLFKK